MTSPSPAGDEGAVPTSGPAAGEPGGAAEVTRVIHRERLWPAPWVWVILLVLAATVGVALLPAAGRAGVVVGGGIATAAVLALIAWWSPVVRVVEVSRGGTRDIWLQAAEARIPAAALGEARPLRGAQWRHELGPALDARAHLCIRGWIGHGVRVEVTDPRDPVPYWLVSSRRPNDVAAALGRVDRNGEPPS